MDEQALKVVFDSIPVALGGVLAVAGGVAAQLMSGKDAMRAEQRQLALELLLRVEKYCDTVSSRSRLFSMDVPAYPEDPLVPLREEIAAHAQGIVDKTARGHMDRIDRVLHWVREPQDLDGKVIPVNLHPLKQACRAILGAVRRNETVPKKIPDLDELYSAAVHVEESIRKALEID